MKTTVSNLQPFGAQKGQDANRFVWSVTKAGCTEIDTAKIYFAKVVITVTDVDSVLAGNDIEIKVTKNDRYSLGDKLKVNYDTIRPTSPFKSIAIIGDTLVFKTKITIPGRDSIYYTLSNQCGVSSTAKVIVLVKNTPPNSRPFISSVRSGTVFVYSIPIESLDVNKNINLSTISFDKSISGVKTSWNYNNDSSMIVFTFDYSKIPYFNGNDKVQFRICDKEIILDCPELIFNISVEGTLIVYNAVSPNADFKNDFFLIEGITPENKVSVKIFNRWGDVVYSEDDYNSTTRRFDGGNLPDGTYYYVIKQSNGAEPLENFLVLQR
ncbi:MAG: gliding motility-associated C-terminal domain-containing protein [Opitutaceae bacterium]|nr:gliding motility-associated C-terminal domain-containing protein [Cytophagales bacterium]